MRVTCCLQFTAHSDPTFKLSAGLAAAPYLALRKAQGSPVSILSYLAHHCLPCIQASKRNLVPSAVSLQGANQLSNPNLQCNPHFKAGGAVFMFGDALNGTLMH